MLKRRFFMKYVLLFLLCASVYALDIDQESCVDHHKQFLGFLGARDRDELRKFFDPASEQEQDAHPDVILRGRLNRSLESVSSYINKKMPGHYTCQICLSQAKVDDQEQDCLMVRFHGGRSIVLTLPDMSDAMHTIFSTASRQFGEESKALMLAIAAKGKIIPYGLTAYNFSNPVSYFMRSLLLHFKY